MASYFSLKPFTIFFFIFITITTFFLSSHCDDADNFSKCSIPYDCGDFKNVTFPFWGDSRPQFYGLQGFDLVCKEDHFFIHINELEFRILKLNQSKDENKMTIAMANSCSPPESLNATLDFHLFKFNPKEFTNLTLIYCSEPLWQLAPPPKYFSCGYQGTCHTVQISILQATFKKIMSGIVKVAEALREEEFEVQYHVPGMEQCEACRELGGICGSNNQTNSFACYCRDHLADQYTCNHHQKKGVWKLKFGLDYAHMNAKRYRFSDVKKMTSSFKNRLGQGGYGEVYKGKLLDGSLVAVKVLNSTKENGQDFTNEIASICRTSHVNVVTLLGFCLEGNKRALIYEYMPNGSLEKFIYSEIPLLVSPRLEWEKLLLIATGIARGLEYLHRGCNTRILHFGIKPHNILLDEDLCPKISDFGLAKLCPKKESIVSMLDARGTIGYIAPEVWSRNFGGVSSKSDVYSYGMMTLEMAGGRKNIYKYLELNNSNVEWQGIRTSEESEIARKMLVVGLWCIQTKPVDRPSMSKVIEMFEGSLEALQIPPKPYLFSPRSPEVLAESLAKSSTIPVL
ncbi:hypothetical protein UlMin_008593 [Ulmus minor]